jgi:hypothetical protein
MIGRLYDAKCLHCGTNLFEHRMGSRAERPPRTDGPLKLKRAKTGLSRLSPFVGSASTLA